MRFDIISLFPEIFCKLKCNGITKNSYLKKIWNLYTWNPRKFSSNLYGKIDYRNYGFKDGLTISPEPLDKLLNIINFSKKNFLKIKKNSVRIFLSPKGKQFNNEFAYNLSKFSDITFICGRYEGLDKRLIDKEIDEEISIGDFVISGGELAALLIIESIIRLLPGVINSYNSVCIESFNKNISGFLENNQYTKPKIWKSFNIPKVLVSGNHKKIKQFRRKESIILTSIYRPDLIIKALLKNELTVLEKIFITSLVDD